MPGPDFYTASFIGEHRNTITAIGTVLLSIVIAQVASRAMARGVRPDSPEAETRVQLVRRLIFAAIIIVGIGLALAQFPSVKRVAAGVLASSAVIGIVVGFAARQTLANAVAGILLAITQPIRIGDLVTFEEETGEVEDVRLTYTYIRLDNGGRLIVPNERLATGSIANHSIVDPRVQVEVSIWVPFGSDLERALGVLDGEPGVDSIVAESDKEGIRLSAKSWADTPGERGRVAAQLRREWLRRLREEGLSSAAPA